MLACKYVWTQFLSNHIETTKVELYRLRTCFILRLPWLAYTSNKLLARLFCCWCCCCGSLCKYVYWKQVNQKKVPVLDSWQHPIRPLNHCNRPQHPHNRCCCYCLVLLCFFESIQLTRFTWCNTQQLGRPNSMRVICSYWCFFWNRLICIWMHSIDGNCLLTVELDSPWTKNPIKSD